MLPRKKIQEYSANTKVVEFEGGRRRNRLTGREFVSPAHGESDHQVIRGCAAEYDYSLGVCVCVSVHHSHLIWTMGMISLPYLGQRILAARISRTLPVRIRGTLVFFLFWGGGGGGGGGGKTCDQP